MHPCTQALNLTRRACCQLVLLINDSARVPPCDSEFLLGRDETKRARVPPTYTTPLYLSEPAEVAEDHATFFIGVLVLVTIAVSCTVAISKLTKPKLAVGYGSAANYEMMMWLPTGRGRRRSSIFVLLRGMACGRRSPDRNTSLSIVSQMSLSTLPSYQAATSTPSSMTSSYPPPPYYELQSLTGSAYSAPASSGRRGRPSSYCGVPISEIAADTNNNNR